MDLKDRKNLSTKYCKAYATKLFCFLLWKLIEIYSGNLGLLFDFRKVSETNNGIYSPSLHEISDGALKD